MAIRSLLTWTRRHSLATTLLCACVIPFSLRAQAAPTPMTPSEPHEALSFYEGSWTVQERPAEEQFNETCAWLNAGRRHMVCRSRWRAATGPREGMSLFSYRATDSTYLYHGLRAGGAVEALEGRLIPGGFQFWTPRAQGTAGERIRVTMTRVGPQRFDFVAESSVDGGPWKAEGTEHYVPAPRAP